ncbi:MAG TPA: MFS transporter [Verrucomicrobiae bacterium]|nr:MFS transporter [Verrucomicrobiae bacterium]
MNNNRFKLFLMMVLEFFIWGAWLPLIFGYLPGLGFNSTWQQPLILNAFPVAAIIGMFFSNQFADRNFAAEKFLAFSHLVGGLAMLGLAFTTSFWPFFLLMLVHCLFYVPTMSITNSIAFANMKDPKDFGIIRMGGTLGWIMASWPFIFFFVDWDKVHALNPQGFVNWLGAALGNGLTGEALQHKTIWTFIVAGIASLLLAGFSLILPHTPPKKAGEGGAEALAWVEAFKLLKHPFVLVLWIVTLVDASVHNSYFAWAGSFLGAKTTEGGAGIPGNWIMAVMSVGQIAELLTMFILGPTIRRLGWRWTMILGIIAYPIRFGVWAFFPEHQGLIIFVQVLHGICYAFFFATVYIFAEEYFPKDVRSSAQGLFNFMILGVGALVAYSVCPWLSQNVFAHNGLTDWHNLFLVPLFVALGSAVTLALFFHPPKTMAESGSSAQKSEPVRA